MVYSFSPRTHLARIRRKYKMMLNRGLRDLPAGAEYLAACQALPRRCLSIPPLEYLGGKAELRRQMRSAGRQQVSLYCDSQIQFYLY